MRYSKVVLEAIAYELAPDVVTSEELEERLAGVYRQLGIQAGQLALITGILERRFWEPGYSMARGAALAARGALAMSAVPSERLGALIYGGVCRDHFEPATACHVAASLRDDGLPVGSNAMIYDVGNACLGVVNGMLDIADRIELGQIKAGIVVTCETAREIVDTSIARLRRQPSMKLFAETIATLTGGSAAVAVVLSDGSFGAADRPPLPRLRGRVLQSAPEHHQLCRWGVERMDADHDIESDADTPYRQFAITDSPAVLEHGLNLGARTWTSFLREMDWRVEQIDRIVCHQVGASHRKAMLKRLGIAHERDFVAYDYLGNTGTAALPVATALAWERGFLVPGQRVGLLGIGSGLSCVMLGIDW